MSNLRLSYLQKVGGMFVQAIPPPKKVGGIHPPHPPRDLRQCLKRILKDHSSTLEDDDAV